jgi:hypothetical protein
MLPLGLARDEWLRIPTGLCLHVSQSMTKLLCVREPTCSGIKRKKLIASDVCLFKFPAKTLPSESQTPQTGEKTSRI